MASVTVIGIDPGSRCTGWGVVREESGVLRLVDCGAIHVKDADFSARLASIYHSLVAIVERCAPQEAAVEQVFTARNAATALKLGQARGVALAACAAYGLSVRDYPPTLVKKTLVGVGAAEKAQVSFMVGRLLNVKVDWGLDTGDALAIAICHLTMRRFEQRAGLGKK
ncbi:MAG: crossover junction endodeoxyribonuclease RuvC [Betaproteobacteria bacterium]|nr:crossover junction endodeoxyribonuclease RuvC [Betaproteobacteria bacterium]